MSHVVNGYMGGVGKAQNDHAQRVSYENQVNSGLIQKTGGRIVPGSQGCDGWTFGLSRPQRGTLICNIHVSVIALSLWDASPREKKMSRFQRSMAWLLREPVRKLSAGISRLLPLSFHEGKLGHVGIERSQVVKNRYRISG